MKIRVEVEKHQPIIEADLTAVDPHDMWYWIPPDQFIDTGYWNTEFKTRACTLTGDENSCPAVVVLGEADNHKNSRTYKLNKPAQYFAADLISLEKYGIHFTELDPFSEERNFVNNAFTWIYKNGIIFCNGDSGFGAPTPKANCLTGEYGEEWPTVDAYRLCATMSVRPDRNLPEPFMINSHGEHVMAVDSFLVGELPLNVLESSYFVDFMESDVYTTLRDYVEEECVNDVVNTMYYRSNNLDQVFFDYGIEILQDPRVGWITQQELHGNVRDFSFFTQMPNTPFPFITLPTQPAYYLVNYMMAFPERQPLYYAV